VVFEIGSITSDTSMYMCIAGREVVFKANNIAKTLPSDAVKEESEIDSGVLLHSA
jgi:hypothetical protein